MKKRWAEIALGEVLTSQSEGCVILPEEEYREITVSLWGKGVRLRRKIPGSEIASATRRIARKGDFIISKIDARHGAYGFIPQSLDGAVVTNDFPLYSISSGKLHPRWLYWISKSSLFVNLCRMASKGTTNRVRLKESLFVELQIPLPPLIDQKRIVDHFDAVEVRLNHIKMLRKEQEKELLAALRAAFFKIESTADWIELGEVAPLVRREIAIDPDGSYPELGIRSFGRGTFHKPDVLGIETTKRLFEIHEGDLLFSNVFAWEGAIAVAQRADHGRVGSHRFITCACDCEKVLPEYLQFYFLTASGLEKIGQASPGGAGRNRTLGLKKLEKIMVPLPSIKAQYEFLKLLTLRKKIQEQQAKASMSKEALLPSLLDRIFSSKQEF